MKPRPARNPGTLAPPRGRSCAGCSRPRSPPHSPRCAFRRTCPIRRRDAFSSSAPARLRPPWPGRWKNTGRVRCRDWSSRAMATPSHAIASTSSKPRIRCRTRRDGAPRSACSNSRRGLREEDLVLCLFSGGGSSLLPLPLPGLDLEHKQAVNRALLVSGATISEMNCVRRHLSAIKGGRLAAACYPARVLTLLISDVPGDRPIDIASGPTVADPTTSADALAIVDRYGIELPAPVRATLESGGGESLKPGDLRLARAAVRMIATPRMALEARRGGGRQGRRPGAHSRRCHRGRGPRRGPAVCRHGIADRRSKPSVCRALCPAFRRRDDGDRARQWPGRAQRPEFLLSLAIGLGGRARIHALAGDTDGVDGQEEIAGACIGPDSLARAEALGLRGGGNARQQRWARFLFGGRGLGDHGTDAHQRQRFPRHFDRGDAGLLRAGPMCGAAMRLGQRPAPAVSRAANTRCMSFTRAT